MTTSDGHEPVASTGIQDAAGDEGRDLTAEVDRPVTVLLADDDPILQLHLRSLIESWGYPTVTADDGSHAWEICERGGYPDVALLDWMMPGCDGIDLCRRMKETPEAPFVYVILLTSRAEKEDLVVGLDSGADDYLVKPVRADELRSRLNVAARMIRYERRLMEFARDMERLAEERAQQLLHADRLATLGTLAAGIVHEINNPVCYISGSAELLRDHWETLRPLVDEAISRHPESKPGLELIRADMPELASNVLEGAAQISSIVRGLRRFMRKEDPDGFKVVGLNACVRDALRVSESRLRGKATVDLELCEPSPQCRVSAAQIEQVLVNLLINAVDALDGRPDPRITIRTDETESRGRIELENNGPPIPEDELAEIWESFYTTKPHGTGLGLPISAKIIRDHGGCMTAENLDGSRGVRFVVELPTCEADS